MDIRPIRTKADYKAALKIVSRYFDQEPAAGSEDADRFEILLTLDPRLRGQTLPRAATRPD